MILAGEDDNHCAKEVSKWEVVLRMVNNEPNPIKKYYIAYFDILGYKAYFQENGDKVPTFLNMIHTAMQGTLSKINGANQSQLVNTVALMDIIVKVFSDNVLLCMEDKESPFERARLLSFLMMVAEIQRGFIVQCGLFVRGSITKGLLSVNENYVFGQGLIDAVSVEEKTVFPRIEVSQELVKMLTPDVPYTQHEIEQALKIEERLITGVSVSEEELSLYKRVTSSVNSNAIIDRVMQSLIIYWPDEKYILSYLYCFNPQDFITTDEIKHLLEIVNAVFPDDMKYLNSTPVNPNEILSVHKSRVEEQLKRYGDYSDIKTEDAKEADVREHILRKYIWVMAYHNLICDNAKHVDYKILTRCNCDARFVKTTIEVL